jgi:tricorn protease
MSIRSLTLTVAILSAALAAPASEEARLLRFPAVHGGTIVFTQAGDLHAVPASGGAARRLTSHPGYECFPRFSPDGKWLAFTGQYDGNTEVYLMPAEGGDPRRLTVTATLGRDDVSDRMGPNNIVMGWTPDSKRVVFRSRMREANDFIGQLYMVGLDGGLPEQLPFSRGGFCSYSPDGSRLAYNRVFREFRTWKRYRGGMADDIWVHDFKIGAVENITSDPASDLFPMWKGDRIYFLSDRDAAQRMNLYVYDLGSRQTRRLTDFADFDVKFPSLGDDAIVFENGGWLYRFDLASEKAVRVPVTLPNDRPWARGGIVPVDGDRTNYEIAPDGKRALVGARGEVFTVPAKHGPTRNLTRTSAVHERNSKWSPDGKWIAFVSDATGEDEIYIVPQDGSAPPAKLTDEKGPYLYQPYWSPDSTRLLWADKDLHLKMLEVGSKAVKTVATATAGEFSDYAWSPDSKWIAYTRSEEKAMQKVYLYGLEGEKTLEVTDGWTSSYGAAFASDGKYLFFVSDRDFNPIYGDTEWNHVYKDMARIYLVTLGRAVDSPLKPKSDEVEIKADEPAGKGEKGKGKPAEAGDKEEAPKAVTVTVDAEGLQGRIVALPVKAAYYRNLASAGDNLYYIRSTHAGESSELVLFDLAERKETVLAEGADGYELSADGKKMLVGREGDLHLVDAPSAPVELKEPLDLSGLKMRLDRPMEWRHIFEESWRQMREFFYAPNMHGVDWAGVRAKYEPLAAAAAHRADLTYVIGEMIGELNAGHAYTGGGDLPKAPRVRTGLLGAELSKDPATGYFKIVRILPGQNWDPARRSPLTEVGVDVKAGEYILAVDGRPAAPMANLYDALIDTVDRQVKLTVNSKPVPEGARDVVVVPTGDEQQLYYHAWVQGNIAKVDKATGGKVGYLHIPDMSEQGLNEFVKLYYPQLRKQGLIVDVRGNGGGNVSPQVLERLKRAADMIEMSRDTAPRPDPGAVFMGPMVCLLNEFSASDGDIFPFRFKKNGLGKLIGKRSWGGVVGIRGSLPILDGGYLFRPEFAPYGLDGKDWIIEGHGVDPDIVVENDPSREFRGIDDQLDKAVEVILGELKTKEREVPPIPPYPVRNP